MSYPAITYHGNGESSAQRRPHDAAPDLLHPNGVRVDYLSRGADTDGRFGLYRWTFGPNASGPDPHFHRTISETFYVLSGTVLIHDGSTWTENGAGDHVYVPEGGIHGFRNVPEAGPASMLILFSPGADREAYFEGLAAGLNGLTESERAAFYLEHDNIWVDVAGSGGAPASS